MFFAMFFLMHKEIFILQMGNTFAETRARLGDFDTWIRAAMPAGIRTRLGTPETQLPPPRSLRALVISGSHSMVTRQSPEESQAARWVLEAIKTDVPILGLCYGHQLLAALLGGLVGYLEAGPEVGYQNLTFTSDWYSDPLFGVYPIPRHEAFTFHYQGILSLPPHARSFAHSPSDPHHAVRFGERVWGVQYHPEFTAPIGREYLVRERAALEWHGVPVDKHLMNAVAPRTQDPLLARFAALV